MTDSRADTVAREISVDTDVVFDLLADSYRRTLLIALLEQSPVDAVGPQIRSSAAETQSRDAIEIRAVHTHLPKLEDAGIVERDRKTTEVRRGRRFEEVRPLVQLLCDHGDEFPLNWP